MSDREGSGTKKLLHRRRRSSVAEDERKKKEEKAFSRPLELCRDVVEDSQIRLREAIPQRSGHAGHFHILPRLHVRWGFFLHQPEAPIQAKTVRHPLRLPHTCTLPSPPAPCE